jgi:hypothetical protein
MLIVKCKSLCQAKLVGICNLEGESDTGLNAQKIPSLSTIQLVPSLSAIQSVSSEKKCQGIFQDFQGSIQNSLLHIAGMLQ